VVTQSVGQGIGTIRYVGPDARRGLCESVSRWRRKNHAQSALAPYSCVLPPWYPHGTLASFTGHTVPRKLLFCLAPFFGDEMKPRFLPISHCKNYFQRCRWISGRPIGLPQSKRRRLGSLAQARASNRRHRRLPPEAWASSSAWFVRSAA
jgi:hypothetical protein